MSIVIMLNNFFHDFSVALLFASLVIMSLLERASRKEDFVNRLDFAKEIYRGLNKVVIGAWIFIIVGGVVRTITYVDYEWSEAAGRGQVAALIVKHVLLILFVVAGTWLQLRLRKKLGRESGQKVEL